MTKILGIDTAQESAAERFLRRLRTALDDLDARPLQYREPVGDLLTRIFLGNAPRRFALGRECRMQDAAEASAMTTTAATRTIRWRGSTRSSH